MPENPNPAWLDLAPVTRAAGTVRLPGSKSISNRVLLLAALASGETAIHGVLHSEDTERMFDALKKLGIVSGQTADIVRVKGCAAEIPVKDAELFLGNAGTALRPLTAALALAGGHYKLRGVARMHERPIGDLVDALRELGADVRYSGNAGFPPLEIFPSTTAAGGRVRVGGEVSSQFLTALLMALPLARAGAGEKGGKDGAVTTIAVDGELISKPYVAITLELMRRFGVEVERDGWREFRIMVGQSYRSPGTFHVEGDASSASYFLAAGAIGGPVRVEGVGRDSIQGDVRFIEALETMGARISTGDSWIEARAPSDGRLRAFDGDCNAIPDAAMTLAVLALFAEGCTHLRNIASWRVKETDRISAMATELRKVGAMVEAGPDDIKITPPAAYRVIPGAAIDTYDDHRMAMCFSLVCLAGVPVRIKDPGCVAKTFPDYFERFASICRAGLA
jgi:3-phosphoshikimate 1-carboxyvinyltransferase